MPSALFLSWEWVYTSPVQTVKRIPKGARLLWSDVLARALSEVAANPTAEERWLRLFALPKMCLRVPPRGGKKKKAAFVAVKFLVGLLTKAKAGEWDTLVEEAQASCKKRAAKATHQPRKHAEAVKERVLSLVEEGQLSKACKALDAAGMHELTPQVSNSLAAKHPFSDPLPPPAPAVGPTPVLGLEKEQILKALGGFRTGTAPGASRFRVSHFRDALEIPTGDSEGRVSRPLTQICNVLVKGEAPTSIAPWLSGAPLFPLKKKDGGVRPIAVGEVLRRLVSRACCAAIRTKADAHFLPLGQVGVGVRGGAEAAVQAVRLALNQRDEPEDFVVLKVDFENAFNSGSRAAILGELENHFPELVPWFRYCYGQGAALTCQGCVLPFKSTTGVQQGDPLGPFLFSLSLTRCCARLKSELSAEALSVWYLDDGTIAGPRADVEAAWQIIREEAGRVGLRVNLAKCELYTPRGTDLSSLPAEFIRLPADGFELLGSPIGDPTFCASYVRKRVARIRSALDSLSLLDDPQVELHLLRGCLGFPKFGFALRSAPTKDISPAIEEFDKVISSVCADRLGLSLTPGQTMQLHLPTASGGCGIVRAADVANAAYLGNTLAVRGIVATLLRRDVPFPEFPAVQECLDALRTQTHTPESLPAAAADLPAALSALPAAAARHPQHTLSELVHAANRAKLLATPLLPREKLRLQAVTRPEAGSWLAALPSKPLGTKFSKVEFSVLLRWWLGLPVFSADSTPCPEPRCPEVLDPSGDHAVMCASGPSRISRHDAVNQTWAHALKGAGFHVAVEVHVDPDSQRRSADTLADNWDHGRQCAHDWVVTHALQKEAVTRKTPDPDTALKHAEAYKNSYAKQRCEERGVDFLPLAIDTFGGFGELAQQAIRKAANGARLMRNEDCALSRSRLLQRLQVSAMMGVARQLLRRQTYDDDEV